MNKFNSLMHLFWPFLTQKEMCFCRMCKLVEFENATKALEKAKPKNQEMVRFWQTHALHMMCILLVPPFCFVKHDWVFAFTWFTQGCSSASKRIEGQVKLLNDYSECHNYRMPNCFMHAFFIFSFKKLKTMQRKHKIQFQKLQRMRWIKWY